MSVRDNNNIRNQDKMENDLKSKVQAKVALQRDRAKNKRTHELLERVNPDSDAQRRFDQGCHPDLAHLTLDEVSLRLRAYKGLYKNAVQNSDLSIERSQELRNEISFLEIELDNAYRRQEGYDAMYERDESPF